MHGKSMKAADGIQFFEQPMNKVCWQLDIPKV
jgi:hypothetical protein